jgi:hypothetical protein
MICRKSLLLAGAFCLGLASAPVNAAPFISDSFEGGFYREDGSTSISSTSFVVGYAPSNNVVLHNWLIFDLTFLLGRTVTSANLTVFGNNSGNYESPDPSETYVLYDYSGDKAQLVLGTGGVAAFTDLGNGTSYGQATVSGPAGPMGQISIDLSSAALNDIMAAGASLTDPRFVIGGALLSLSRPAFPQNELLFSLSGQNLLFPIARLTLEVASPVPLPGALPLFASALGLAGLLGYRRKRRAALATATSRAGYPIR